MSIVRGYHTRSNNSRQEEKSEQFEEKNELERESPRLFTVRRGSVPDSTPSADSTDSWRESWCRGVWQSCISNLVPVPHTSVLVSSYINGQTGRIEIPARLMRLARPARTGRPDKVYVRIPRKKKTKTEYFQPKKTLLPTKTSRGGVHTITGDHSK